MRLHVLTTASVPTTASALPSLAGLSACHQVRSFRRNRRVIVPTEAAQHCAMLATGSFLVTFWHSGSDILRRFLEARTSSRNTRSEASRGLAVGGTAAQPGGNTPKMVDGAAPSAGEALACPHREEGLTPPLALLPGTLTQQNVGSQVPSLGSHPLSTRCSHLTHPPSAEVLGFMSKPAFCPNRTHCF